MTSAEKLAQRLHDKWCRQMREKGFHGFLEKCPSSPECNLPYYKCEKYRVGICDYALIGTIWQQEYLATVVEPCPVDAIRELDLTAPSTEEGKGG